MNNTNYTSIPSISPNKIINTTVDYINKNHKTDASIYESKNKNRRTGLFICLQIIRIIITILK